MKDDRIVKLFGIRMRNARLVKGFTLVQMEQLTGIAQATLSRYETGNREPTLSNVYKIVKALRCNFDYMVGIQ